jgi:hypothetical protein
MSLPVSLASVVEFGEGMGVKSKVESNKYDQTPICGREECSFGVCAMDIDMDSVVGEEELLEFFVKKNGQMLYICIKTQSLYTTCSLTVCFEQRKEKCGRDDS